MDFQSIKIGENTVQYFRKGTGTPVIFIPGLGAEPYHFEEFVNLLAQKYDVISPRLIGINYLERQPDSIKGYADLTKGLINELGLKEYCLIGHSVGGAVAFTLANDDERVKKVIGINPMLNSEYSHIGFALRVAYKCARETTGMTGGKSAVTFGMKTALPAILNSSKDISGLYKIVADINRFRYDTLHIPAPALIMWGQEDEYFRLEGKMEESVRRAFKNIEIKKFPKRNHDWPAFFAKEAFGAVDNFLSEK